MDSFLLAAAADRAALAAMEPAWQRARTAQGATHTDCAELSLGLARASVAGTRCGLWVDGQTLRAGLGDAHPLAAQSGAFEDWIERCQGSFAALEYGAARESLRLARDRAGAVPVYCLEKDGLLLASNRLACLLAFLDEAVLDHAALAECLRFRWCTSTATLLGGITQLGAGCSATWTAAQGLRSQRWWSMGFSGDGPADPELQGGALHAALRTALADTLARSRHPALLLSGGVDSSVIAAVARETRPRIPCYIASIPGTPDEELRRARVVAAQLGLPLRVVTLDSARLPGDLQRVVALLEEPPRNPNNLVLLQLYEAMAHDGIDTALNGDGPEMLLGLADTQRVRMFAAKHRRACSLLPQPLRRAIGAALRRVPHEVAWRIARVLVETPLDYALALDAIGYSLPVRRCIGNAAPASMPGEGFPHADCFAEHPDPDDALHHYQLRTTLLSSQRRHEALASSCGIHAATPFLHPALLAFAAQQPRALRFAGRSRPVLKALCDTLVSPDVARWQKLGFPVPWRDWLAQDMHAAGRCDEDWTGLADVLPRGFVPAALAASDPEALWTLLTLKMTADCLGLRRARA